MLIPTIPTFSNGEYSIDHLQQLSNAVSLMTNGNLFPIWRFIKSATMSPTAGSWQTIPYNTVEYDSDNVHNQTTGGVQINTQGYYYCESCTPVQNAASTQVITLSFLWTAGGSNPNYSSGTTNRFGGACGTASTTASTDYVYCQADMCPVVCYPGDSIVVQIYPTLACVTDTLSNSSATSGWFAPQFSGRWIRTGS